MGDIAEMMLDGILDMHTGEYIGDSVGYPRTFQKHGTNHFKHSDKKYGIYYYCMTLGITKKQRRTLLVDFYPNVDNKHNFSNEILCEHASDNFKEFKKFIQCKTSK